MPFMRIVLDFDFKAIRIKPRHECMNLAFVDNGLLMTEAARE
jgi:hypothetical protein